MAEGTIVSIYEVNEWAATGPWVGQGSLVGPKLVLVHPPLCDQIAAGTGPDRVRVGLLPGEGAPLSRDFCEVIDVWGKPHVLGSADDLAVVALELSRPARSPSQAIPGLRDGVADEENFKVVAKYLKVTSAGDWAPLSDRINAFWCKFLAGICHK